MEAGDVLVGGLPSAADWLTVSTGATLVLNGPLEIQGNGYIAIHAPPADSVVYATSVTFSGFIMAPLAVPSGSAYLQGCTFKNNACPGISVYLGGTCWAQLAEGWPSYSTKEDG
jgi:hypothetical protein